MDSVVGFICSYTIHCHTIIEYIIYLMLIIMCYSMAPSHAPSTCFAYSTSLCYRWLCQSSHIQL